jgi:hypothetical protein
MSIHELTSGCRRTSALLFRSALVGKFESASCAQPSLSAAVVHLWRWSEDGVSALGSFIRNSWRESKMEKP